ncbi:hypothetical protein DQ04_13431000 [Trypanosoma grayi]|uniref:hypothetical protein n=1 Tax=Trypanosoma grayi TaxID=71804 RepID=UPI0004F47E3A|nr:hypothetical protein DQ04_13431000 [Trypanosoma grayi]KEG06537.1 hypothetical protein DQ04_13431000 [Trypanosoma grayi]
MDRFVDTGVTFDVDKEPRLINCYLVRESGRRGAANVATSADVFVDVEDAPLLNGYDICAADSEEAGGFPELRAFATQWADGRIETVGVVDDRAPFPQVFFLPPGVSGSGREGCCTRSRAAVDVEKHPPLWEAPTHEDGSTGAGGEPGAAKGDVVVQERAEGAATAAEMFHSLDHGDDVSPLTHAGEYSQGHSPLQPSMGSMGSHSRSTPLPRRAQWEMFSKHSPCTLTSSLGRGGNSILSQRGTRAESLSSLKNEIAAFRERLRDAQLSLHDSVQSQHVSSTATKHIVKRPPPTHRDRGTSLASIRRDVEYSPVRELRDSNGLSTAGSYLLNAVREAMQQGTLLSAPRERGNNLREAWMRDATLPAQLHRIADIEGTGFVRLSRLLVLLRLHDYLDWTEDEVTRICAWLSEHPDDEARTSSSEAQVRDDRTPTCIVINEVDDVFYLNSGAFFALLRALLLL